MGHPYTYHKYCVGCRLDLWNDHTGGKHELDLLNEQCDACYQEYLEQEQAWAFNNANHEEA